MTATRRSSADLRALLIKSAEQVFAEKGYVSATTKDLAQAAGVAESVMFRHFPSKAALFRESVLEPLTKAMSTFADTVARYLEQPLGDVALMRLTVSELYDQLSLHRASLRSFGAAEDDLGEAGRADFHRMMDGVLAEFGAVARAEADRRGRGRTGLGAEMSVRVLIGTIISLVIYDEWITGVGDDRPSRAALMDHVSALVLNGIG